MLLHVDKLRAGPWRAEINERAADFPILQDLSDQGAVFFVEPIVGNLEAVRVSDIIEVKGQVATEISVPCARCLEPIGQSMDLSFTLCYSNSDNREGLDDSEEVELQSDDLGLIVFEGLEIDLKPDLEQELVMALPQQILCQETCKGLCAECGVNLNRKQCQCEKPLFHVGLTALKNFKVE